MMRSIGGTNKRGTQIIARHPSAQQRPPSAQSIADKRIPPGKRNFISPKPSPGLQTSPPDPPETSILNLTPQLDPVRVSIQSSPSVDMAQMRSEVQNRISGWKTEAAAQGEVKCRLMGVFIRPVKRRHDAMRGPQIEPGEPKLVNPCL